MKLVRYGNPGREKPGLIDDEGRIRELKVMLRPASALQAVGARMTEEFPLVGLGLPS